MIAPVLRVEHVLTKTRDDDELGANGLRALRIERRARRRLERENAALRALLSKEGV